MMKPKRGEIWLVEFEPQRGAEIQKTRPAVVRSIKEKERKYPTACIFPQAQLFFPFVYSLDV
jgi:mRNA-degrading endonuclease toxin of MazEF toxin-antitoxin module